MLLHAVFFMPVYCLSLALPLSEVYTFSAIFIFGFIGCFGLGSSVLSPFYEYPSQTVAFPFL